MKVIVDTNVAIAANGRGTHASAKCQLKCVELLQGLASPTTKRKLVLDDLGLIFEEYGRHLNFRGQPGVGDFFYKYLHDNMYADTNVELVSITANDDPQRGFNELPKNTIDPSDRKLLAAAISGKAKIINALDTDWHEQDVFLKLLPIVVQQVCPEHGCV